MWQKLFDIVVEIVAYFETLDFLEQGILKAISDFLGNF